MTRHAHSLVALARQSVALQARRHGDVGDDGAAAATLQTHLRGLGLHWRGRDDDAVHLHQAGHLVGLERKGIGGGGQRSVDRTGSGGETEGESRGGTLRLRMEAWWASLLSITWISCTASSPTGRGRVTSSATSFAASSSCRDTKHHITHCSCCIIFTTGGEVIKNKYFISVLKKIFHVPVVNLSVSFSDDFLTYQLHLYTNICTFNLWCWKNKPISFVLSK